MIAIIIRAFLLVLFSVGFTPVMAEDVDKAEIDMFLKESNTRHTAEVYGRFYFDLDDDLVIIAENLVIQNIVKFRAITLLMACEEHQLDVVSKIMDTIDIDSVVIEQFPGETEEIMAFRQSVKLSIYPRLGKLRQGAAILSGMITDQYRAGLCQAGKELALEIVTKA